MTFDRNNRGHGAAEPRPPREIIAELKALEKGIADGLAELEAML